MAGAMTISGDDDDVPAALPYVDEALPTLPSAEALAHPMLESIYALHRLDQLAWSLGFIQPHHGAEYAEAAMAVVKLLEETAGLTESAVRSCLTRRRWIRIGCNWPRPCGASVRARRRRRPAPADVRRPSPRHRPSRRVSLV